MYEGIPIRLSNEFSAETLQARREWHVKFEVLEEKNLCNQECSDKTVIQNRRDKELLREAKTKRVHKHYTTSLKAMKKGLL